MPTMTKGTRRHPLRTLLFNLLGVAVAFALLALTIWKNRADLAKVWVERPDYSLYALAFVAYLAGCAVAFTRWYYLVRVIDRRFTIGTAFLLGFIGLVFNLVIPGGVGGDFVKAAYLVRMDINRTQAVGSMIIDRILGLLGLFLLAGLAGLAAWTRVPEKVHILIAVDWLATLGGFVVLFAVFNQSLTNRYPGLLERHDRISAILHEFKAMSSTYRSRLDLVAGALGGSVLVHASNVVAFYLVSRAIFRGGLPGLGEHLLIVPLTLFTTAVPLPFGALGLAELVSSGLWKLLDYEKGATAMLGFRVLMYGGGLVASGVYLANIKQVRGLTETAEELKDELAEDELGS